MDINIEYSGKELKKKDIIEANNNVTKIRLMEQELYKEKQAREHN